jgi:hypothetical protein
VCVRARVGVCLCVRGCMCLYVYLLYIQSFVYLPCLLDMVVSMLSEEHKSSMLFLVE